MEPSYRFHYILNDYFSFFNFNALFAKIFFTIPFFYFIYFIFCWLIA